MTTSNRSVAILSNSQRLDDRQLLSSRSEGKKAALFPITAVQEPHSLSLSFSPVDIDKNVQLNISTRS